MSLKRPRARPTAPRTRTMSRPDQVRPMRADDLDAVLRIQALCYTKSKALLMT